MFPHNYFYVIFVLFACVIVAKSNCRDIRQCCFLILHSKNLTCLHSHAENWTKIWLPAYFKCQILNYNKTVKTCGLTPRPYVSVCLSVCTRYCISLPAWLVERWLCRTWLQHAALPWLLSGGASHAGSVHEDPSEGHVEGSHQRPFWPDGEDTHESWWLLVSSFWFNSDSSSSWGWNMSLQRNSRLPCIEVSG